MSSSNVTNYKEAERSANQSVATSELLAEAVNDYFNKKEVNFFYGQSALDEKRWLFERVGIVMQSVHNAAIRDERDRCASIAMSHGAQAAHGHSCAIEIAAAIEGEGGKDA